MKKINKGIAKNFSIMKRPNDADHAASVKNRATNLQMLGVREEVGYRDCLHHKKRRLFCGVKQSWIYF